MNRCAIEVIGEKRAARAALHPAGAKHEMIDDKLALIPEQFPEHLAALRYVKSVGFVHLGPGQGAPGGAERVAGFGEFLFVGKQSLARGKPFLLRNHGMLHDQPPRFVVSHVAAGVIHPMPAPPGSISTAMRPTPGTSKIGFINFAPALCAFFTRASTSSTAM